MSDAAAKAYNEQQRDGCVQAGITLGQGVAALVVFAGHDVINRIVAVAAAKATIERLQKLVDECEQALAAEAKKRQP